MPTPDLERQHRLQRNLVMLSAFRVFQMAMIPVAIVPLYWRDELGLDMGDVFLIQAIFGLYAALLEFPGGYVSDRIGYRTALGIACLCSGLGWRLLGFTGDMVGILVAELFLAFSLSLTSGTDAAMMYESLLELDRESEFARWFGRSRSLGASAEGTAALFSGILFAVWEPLPFFLQAGLWGFNLLVVFFMIEPLRVRVVEMETWQHVRDIFHFAAVRSPHLRTSILAILVIGMSTFIPVWMIAVYAENGGLAVAWIGPMWAAANYTVAFGLWVSDRVGISLGNTATLLLCAGLIAIGFFGLGLSHTVGGFAFYYAICLARGLNGPILSHVQQRLIRSADRASLLSINSLLFRASFFLLGPVLGYAIDTQGEHAVLWTAGLIVTPLCIAVVMWLARYQDGDAASPSA